jgi:hypothetical protein
LATPGARRASRRAGVPLDVNSDAIATAVLTFAYDTSSVNAVAGKPGKSNGLFKPGEASS